MTSDVTGALSHWKIKPILLVFFPYCCKKTQKYRLVALTWMVKHILRTTLYRITNSTTDKYLLHSFRLNGHSTWTFSPLIQMLGRLVKAFILGHSGVVVKPQLRWAADFSLQCHCLSNMQVMRIEEVITKNKMSWCLNRDISTWRAVKTMCMLPISNWRFPEQTLLTVSLHPKVKNWQIITKISQKKVHVCLCN